MTPTQESTFFLPSDEPDAPIEVYFGSPTFDLGIGTVPKILPRFWTYLVSDGEKLNDRQYALLMLVLLLRDTQDYELRVANLPMTSSAITLERDKKSFRRMGLVFTQRLYYPKQAGKTPAMRAQRWDLRSLFYNLELIAQLWKTRQRELTNEWESRGRKGNKPIYRFPDNFVHEVVLPADVAMNIIQGVYYPIPEKWQRRARVLLAGLPAEHNRSGAGMRTEPETSGTQPTEPDKSGTPTGPEKSDGGPTGLITRGHLLEDEEDEEDETTALAGKIFAYFAHCKGDEHYQPAAKEQAALEKLLADGFTCEEIIAGIDQAFARPNKPRHFTHCAAIARDRIDSIRQARTQQEIPQPETRQPEGQNAAALPEPEKSESSVVIEADLARAVDVFRSAGREVTPDLLARFRLMAVRCDPAARKAASTGSDWLADAITAGLGVAKSANLLNYADAVLNDWIANGRAGQVNKPARKPRPTPKGKTHSGVHDGIRDYLEQRGGIPDGE
jgi:hypothetical protein